MQTITRTYILAFFILWLFDGPISAVSSPKYHSNLNEQLMYIDSTCSIY